VRRRRFMVDGIEQGIQFFVAFLAEHHSDI
jgi:hypothetical protein